MLLTFLSECLIVYYPCNVMEPVDFIPLSVWNTAHIFVFFTQQQPINVNEGSLTFISSSNHFRRMYKTEKWKENKIGSHFRSVVAKQSSYQALDLLFPCSNQHKLNSLIWLCGAGNSLRASLWSLSCTDICTFSRQSKCCECNQPWWPLFRI